MRLFLLLILFAVDAFAINGGQLVPPNHPIALSTVKVGRGKDPTCTGTLISPEWVISAAHCIDKSHRGARSFTPGSHIAFPSLQAGVETEYREILEWRFHQEWMKGMMGVRGLEEFSAENGDFVALRFQGDVPTPYRPALILGAGEELRSGDQVVIAGFGGEARTLNMISRLIAKAYPFGRYEVHLDQKDNRGACSGDSGGPAFIERDGRFYFWGVLSRALGWKNADDLCRHFTIYGDFRRVQEDLSLSFVKD